MSGALEDRIVVAEVHRAVGEHAVLLIGSRAVGSAELSSDYDIVVALPLLLVPLRLRRLEVAGTIAALAPSASERQPDPKLAIAERAKFVGLEGPARGPGVVSTTGF